MGNGSVFKFETGNKPLCLPFDQAVKQSLPECMKCWDSILRKTAVRTNSDGIPFHSKFAMYTIQTDTTGFMDRMFDRGTLKHDKPIIYVVVRFVFGMSSRTEEVVSY